MRIVDLLDRRSIEIAGHATDKNDVIRQMVDLMEHSGKINNKEKYLAGVFHREEESTTGVGEGIAIPHCKSDAVNSPGLAAMVVKDGVDFDSLDGEPVYLIFLIAAPDTEDNVHLDVLGRLSVFLMDEAFTDQLKSSESVEEFLAIIDQADKEDGEYQNRTGENQSETGQDQKHQQTQGQTQHQTSGYVLAVTGCPTGIAHTYMAAEALEKKARELGISIKVETRGSGGAKNVLTDEEIEKADGIIVAADTNVPMERFAGKKLVEVPVSDGISKPEQLLRQALDANTPEYGVGGQTTSNQKGGSHSKKTAYGTRSTGTNSAGTGPTGKRSAETGSERTGSSSNLGHQVYKHLMNGVSHMLPFVVSGGILIAIAFLLDDYEINPSNYGMNTPVAAWFKSIGGYAFNFMLPILAGYIAMSIADRPGLLVGFVGGYLALTGATFMNPTADNAISAGFLGALFAGFAGGIIVLILQKLFAGLPDALDGLKPVLIFPVLGVILIAVIMSLVNPIMGAINTGLASFLNSMGTGSKILLGCVLGTMMSIDMGGPFNKAAYVFGTGMLSEQTDSGLMIMAAVMVGGMVPPFAIALATTFFPDKFSAQERKSGIVNYLMGLSFITEGAIPYAAADPLRVIPSCIVGAALAGGLSMAFGCTLRAPHGGIFVLGTVGNWLGYLAAFLIGSAVSAILLGILKKKVEYSKNNL